MLSEEPIKYPVACMGTRVAFINGYSWAIITKFDGLELFRSDDIGETWESKGTILTHTSALTSLEASLFADYDNDLFYWTAHVYKSGSAHAIYVGQVDLSDADNPSIGSAIDVSSDTTTSGYYFPTIVESGAGYFFLSYMTERAGSSPYHQYYTLMTSDYTDWTGTTELNIANSASDSGRIMIARRRGYNGVCVCYINNSRVVYRYNANGNANLNGDWTAAADVFALAVQEPPTNNWYLYKPFDIIGRSNGEIWCTFAEVGQDFQIFRTSTFSGAWTSVGSIVTSFTAYNIATCFRDNGNSDELEEMFVALSGTSSLTGGEVYLRRISDGSTVSESVSDIVSHPSLPEYVVYMSGGLPALYQKERPTFTSPPSGTWTSEVRNTSGATTWGNLSIQDMDFPDSGFGASATYYVETRTGAVAVPDVTWEAWTAATDLGSYLYQVNSTANDYVQLRITMDSSPTLHDFIIPQVKVSDGDPLPIQLSYSTGVYTRPMTGITWYMRYKVLRYNR